MRGEWKTAKVGDVCSVIAGQSPKGSAYNDQGKGLPFYQGKKHFGELHINKPTTWTMQVTKEALPGDILMSVRAPVGPVNFSNDKICIGRGLAAIRAGESVDRMFLFYALLSMRDEIRGNDGAVFASINKKQIESIEIPLPPLPEQKRIIAILDEAFAGIATAVANTEKNLANARELFESYLNSVFIHKGEGWYKSKIGEQVTLQRGFDITKKEQRSGTVPVISSGGVKSYHDTAKVSGPGVIIGRKGSLGTVFYVEGEFWPHDTTLWVKDFKENNPKLVYYFFRALDVKRFDSGTANPSLNRNMVHPIESSWPLKKRQDELVKQLDNLAGESKRLESIYQQKLAALAELKQSLLQKAFSGELTAEVDSEVREAVA